MVRNFFGSEFRDISPKALAFNSQEKVEFSNILVQKTLIVHLILEGGHCAQQYGYLWKVYKKVYIPLCPPQARKKSNSILRVDNKIAYFSRCF